MTGGYYKRLYTQHRYHPVKLSAFGEKFAGDSGIVELMDDLGSALNENPDMIFMGGGNPGRLQEVERKITPCLEEFENCSTA